MGGTTLVAPGASGRRTGLRRQTDDAATPSERNPSPEPSPERLAAHRTPQGAGAEASTATLVGTDVGMNALRDELYRSRRYGRTFAVIGLPLASHAPALQARLRPLDRVWSTDDQIYVLVPEADGEVAAGLLARVSNLGAELADPRDARVAVFPHDALTAEALVSAVTVPRPRARVADKAAERRRRDLSFRALLRGRSLAHVVEAQAFEGSTS